MKRVTVRSHTARSKKGKVSQVRQHSRLSKKAKMQARLERRAMRKQLVSEYASASFLRAVEAGRGMIRAKDSKEMSGMMRQFRGGEMKHALKFVGKHFPTKSETRAQKRAARFVKRSGRLHQRVFARALKLRKRLEKKGKLYTGEGHPVMGIKPGHKIKYAGDALFNRWRVTGMKVDGDVRHVQMENVSAKNIKREVPIATLASQFDRGMIGVSSGVKKVKKAKKVAKAAPKAAPKVTKKG